MSFKWQFTTVYEKMIKKKEKLRNLEAKFKKFDLFSVIFLHVNINSASWKRVISKKKCSKFYFLDILELSFII